MFDTELRKLPLASIVKMHTIYDCHNLMNICHSFFMFASLKTKKKIDEWTWFKHCDRFRKGTFQNAKEEVKKGWVTFCDYVLAWVNWK
jgi:hypothetical protein